MSTTREDLLDLIESVRDQRDALYTQTVNPRRYAHTALQRLRDGKPEDAEGLLENIAHDLDSVAQLYADQMKAEI